MQWEVMGRRRDQRAGVRSRLSVVAGTGSQESTRSFAHTSDRFTHRRGARGLRNGVSNSQRGPALLCWPPAIVTHMFWLSLCGTFRFIISVSLGSDTAVKWGWGVRSDYSQDDVKRQALGERATSLVPACSSPLAGYAAPSALPSC